MATAPRVPDDLRQLARPLITGRPILESGGPFPLDRHDVRGDVRHAADNGQPRVGRSHVEQAGIVADQFLDVHAGMPSITGLEQLEQKAAACG